MMILSAFEHPGQVQACISFQGCHVCCKAVLKAAKWLLCSKSNWLLSVWESWSGKKRSIQCLLCAFYREFSCLDVVLSRVRAGTSCPVIWRGAINKQWARWFPPPPSASYPCLLSTVNTRYHLFPVHQKGQSFAQNQPLRFVSGTSCFRILV